MCGNFWLKIISQRFPTHRTALAWLRAIPFYSPSSKPTWKDIILGEFKTSRQLRRGLWTTCQVKTSYTVMKGGSNVGIAVFDHKEYILKGINCNCMYVQNFLNHSHYFLDRLRILLFQTNWQMFIFLNVHGINPVCLSQIAAWLNSICTPIYDTETCLFLLFNWERNFSYISIHFIKDNILHSQLQKYIRIPK